MLTQDVDPDRCCHTAGLRPLEEMLQAIETLPPIPSAGTAGAGEIPAGHPVDFIPYSELLA